MELQGKNVILVGGYGGIGEKCVEAFLKKSVKSIIIFDIKSNKEYLKYLQNTYAKSYVDYIHMDLTKGESIQKAYLEAKEKIGSFDVMVNASGILNENNIDQLMQINLIGLIHSSLTALDYMSKSKGGNGGSIINISSIAGLDPSEYFCIYSASKSGVISFTQSMARPLYFDKTGINFITICPGGTLTTIIQQADTCYSNQYFDGLVDVLNGMDKQTPEVFAKNLMEIVETADNGTVWVLNNGTIEEVHMPKVWGQINLE